MTSCTTMDRHGWDERYATSEYVWRLGPNQFVEEHLAGVEPGDAIDLGAGEGRNAVWLAEQGWQVTAVDFSEVGLDKARRLASDRGVQLTTERADVRSWRPAAPVDLVLLAYLQLPDDERLEVLNTVRDWLRPGGTVLVIAHDRRNVDHGHGGPPTAGVCYDPDETAAALAPLHIERRGTVERHVDTDHGTAVALDTLVIAHAPPSD